MKKSILLAITASVFTVVGTFAQGKKIGHADLMAIVAIMPEKAKADTAYANYSKELESEYYSMEKELRDLYADYEANKANRSEGMNKIKEEKIRSKQEEIQTFTQVTIQQELQEKQYKLMTPIIETVEKAIKDVAKEKGYNYVFDRSEGGPLLVWDDADALDTDVKKKLGLPLTEPKGEPKTEPKSK